MFNYKFMVSSVIFISAILTIGLIGNFFPTGHVLTG